jgi:hypothetical protein
MNNLDDLAILKFRQNIKQRCDRVTLSYVEDLEHLLTATQQALTESNEINFRLAMQINELDIKIQKEQQAHQRTIAELQELRGKLKEDMYFDTNFNAFEGNKCIGCGWGDNGFHGENCWVENEVNKLKAELDKIGGR